MEGPGGSPASAGAEIPGVTSSGVNSRPKSNIPVSPVLSITVRFSI
jgi:hypothetical protein